jgi:hypothetical protein
VNGYLFKLLNIIAISALLSLTSCAKKADTKKKKGKSNQSDSISFRVEKAPKWTNLFKRNSGWFGADGIYTIPLNGIDKDNNRVMLLFSDTMIGKIINGQLQSGFTMIHNSIAYWDGSKPDPDHIHFKWRKKKDGSPAAMFTPKTGTAQKKDYYWLGDGFADQATNKIYIFAYRTRTTGRGDFSFEVVGNPIIAIPADGKPPFKNQRQLEAPFFKSGTKSGAFRSFGAGILVNTSSAGAPNPDGYVYIYGIQGSNKQLIAARVKPKDFEDFDQWRYWNGDSWVAQIESVRAITNRVSNELSVSPVGHGKYVLVFTVNGLGPKIGMRIGESPVGPFGPLKVIWKTRANNIDSSFYSYNAKGHPALSSPGELLVSYNVNSFNFSQKIDEYPHLYRPRFIRIIFNQE